MDVNIVLTNLYVAMSDWKKASGCNNINQKKLGAKYVAPFDTYHLLISNESKCDKKLKKQPMLQALVAIQSCTHENSPNPIMSEVSKCSKRHELQDRFL